jgi:hypothetical protein
MPNLHIVLGSSKLVWEIVRGSYGATYTATIEDEDYSGFTALLYVWNRNNTKILNGKSCSVSYSAPNTIISYTIAQGDFPSTMVSGICNGHYGNVRSPWSAAGSNSLPALL